MPSRRVDSTSLFRPLLIACAILGFQLDVLPTPTPGVATSDPASSGGGSPLAPRPDDAERDETPDEVGDLAWPQVKLVARAGSLRSMVGSLCNVRSCGSQAIIAPTFSFATICGELPGPSRIASQFGVPRPRR